MPSIERRAHKRIEIRESVMFGEDEPVHSGKSDNLSPGGMCIISETALPVESNITIKINIKHHLADDTETWEDITVYGRVIWVDFPPGTYSKMGIKFVEENDRLAKIYENLANK